MIPPPDTCPFCKRYYTNYVNAMTLGVFKFTEDEKKKWIGTGLVGAIPTYKWMCKNCYKVYKDNKLGRFETIEGVEKLTKLIKINNL